MASSTAPEVRDLTVALDRAGVEVDGSSRARAEYSADASLYRVVPQAVAFPRDPDDVAAAVSVARSLHTPLTARGAGTSIAGNAVGPGLILDFSRHMNKVLAVDEAAGTATIQPGVVLDTLQAAAAPHQLRYGPDPSTHSRCTLGGILGNNACGNRSLGYGRPSDSIRMLDLLTGDGERFITHSSGARSGGPDSGTGFGAGTGGVRSDGSAPMAEGAAKLSALHRLTSAHLALFRTELGRFGRQVSGYSLEHLLPERGFDVARALVGSEGTLGITVAATVGLANAPRRTILVALGYPDMATAADATPAVLAHHPTALEGLDARIVDIIRRRHPATVPELPRGGGWLLVELAGDNESELRHRAAGLVTDADALAARTIIETAEQRRLWRIREDGAGLASRPGGGRFAHAGWEDAAVPPDRLGAYLRDFDALLVQHGLSGAPYGHFGEGCVHIRIDFPFGQPHGVRVFREFLIDAARLVAGYGGSMSGEHGDGRARSELLPLMYSSPLLAAFAEVKRIFDPDGLLNPGVLVEPAEFSADLRPAAVRPMRDRLALAFADDAGDFANAVHRCTGVGKCRADLTATGGVMCPSFLATRQEKDSTRGRARVLQEMVNGTRVRRDWRAPEVHEALDLCLQCKGCAVDCPTGVDMASYKVEVLHQSYRGRPRPVSHYTLGWLPRWARLASRAPRLANRLVALGDRAPIGKRLAGVDPRRRLPRFAAQTFRDWFARRQVAGTGDPVMLWVDTFTNHFTPEVGQAAVRVIEAAGLSVQIPDGPLCCGLTWLSTGQLSAARKQLRRSITALAPAARQGVPVVGLEPSCAALFRGDAGELLGDDADQAAVSGAVHTLAELLTSRAGWRPPDLSGVRGVAQPHCHQHAALGWDADQALLQAGGAAVRAVGGCCGLAGNFGAERGHFEISRAVAETALLPAVRDLAEGELVLADGFSCRTQLDQLAGVRSRHLAEVLADPPVGAT